MFGPRSHAWRIARHESKCRRRLYDFARYCWPVVDPDLYVDGWHVQAVCEHLQAVTDGQIRKLIIEIPPGHAKSTLSCVIWPSWEWISKPEERSIFGSYDYDLAIRDSLRMRDLVCSDWYTLIFEPQWKIRKDQFKKTYYINTLNGNRYTFGMRRGGRAGWRGRKVVVDDPISIDDAFDNRIKADTYKRYNGTLSTRVNDLATASFVVIGHRIASDDLQGRLIDEGGYDVLKLPSLFDPAKRTKTSIGWEDPRKNKDDLLFEAKFPRVELDYLHEKKLGPEGFACQHQQEPSPEEGRRFKRERFRYYERDGDLFVLHRKGGVDEAILRHNCWTFVSMDCASEENTWNDFTVFGEWAVTKYYDMILLNLVMGRWDEPHAIEMGVDLYTQSGYGGRSLHTAYLVESNGVGIALAQGLAGAGLPVVKVPVSQDKIQMSSAAAIRMSAGSIFFPWWQGNHLYPWMKDFEEELLNFPGVEHDDRTSMISIAAHGVYKTGIMGIGGEQQVELIEKPTASQVIQRSARKEESLGVTSEEWNQKSREERQALIQQSLEQQASRMMFGTRR